MEMGLSAEVPATPELQQRSQQKIQERTRRLISTKNKEAPPKRSLLSIGVTTVSIVSLDLDSSLEVGVEGEALKHGEIRLREQRLNRVAGIVAVSDGLRARARSICRRVTAGTGDRERGLRAAEAAVDQVRERAYQRYALIQFVAGLHVQLQNRRRDVLADAVETSRRRVRNHECSVWSSTCRVVERRTAGAAVLVTRIGRR